MFAIRYKGEYAGGCSIRLDGHVATIGYWIGEGKGIMTRVVNRVILYCFDDLEVVRVEADPCEELRVS